MSLITKKASRIGLAVSVAVLLSACGGGEERQARYLERAQEHFDAGNMEKALVDVKNAVQINPNSAEAHYLRALIAEQEKDWRSAFGQLNLTVDLDPEHVDAAIKLAELTLAANDMEAAQDRAARALKLAPDNADAMSAMAAVHYKNGDLDEAVRLAEQALQVNPAQVNAVGILSAMNKDDPEAALAYIDAGLASAPDEGRLHRLRLATLERLGRTDDAIAEFKVLIALEPENYLLVGQLADYHIAKFQVDEAEDLLRASIKEHPEATQLKIYLVRALIQNSTEEAALGELQAMVAEEPGNFELRNILAQQRLKSGEVARAIELYEQAFDHEPSVEDAQAARNALAGVARSQGDLETAAKWIDEALEVEPENPDALLIRGSMKMVAGDHRGAIPDLRMVLRANPASVPAMLVLAEAQRKDGSVDLALDNFQSVLALQPGNPVALYQGAQLLAARGDYDSAIDYLETLLEADPVNVTAINLLTAVYSQQGKWDEAERLLAALPDEGDSGAVADLLGAGLELRRQNFDKSLELANRALAANGDLLSAVSIGARAYAGKGDLDGAVKYVQAYSDKNPTDAGLYETLGQLHMARKQPAEAAVVLNKAIEAEPTRIAGYLSLGHIYYRQGELDKVEALYLRGVAANPDTVLLRAELALRLQLRGDYEGARELLEQAYELDESSQLVTNNLASLLIDHFPTQENLRRVQEMTLGFEDSSQAAELDTLGWLQYRLGNIPQAIRLLEAAQAAGGQGPEYWYHLGLVYAQNGQVEDAKSQLEKALGDETAQFHGRTLAQKTYDGL